jgi:butyrate kinase
MKHIILAINPGSTSTKIAIYEGSRPLFLKNISHPHADIARFTKITEQYEYRKNHIINELSQSHIDVDSIEAIVARGGLLHPIKSGVYIINDRMKNDLRQGLLGEHASNLGGLIADEIARNIPNCKAYIADPVVVDEMQEVARFSGHPKFKRLSIFHALNQKATGRAYARLINKKYDELNLIIAHMGGGISVGAHYQGKVIDVNQALDGEGPFSPERTGTLPAGALASMCFEENMTLDKVKKMIGLEGGLTAYLGTNNAYEVELRAQDGDDMARLIQDAMSYQIGKEIGALSTVLKGKIDAIILTGGISHNPMVVEYIKQMVSFIAPVIIYPGEDELHALIWNGLLVLRGELVPKDYDESNMVS